MILFEGYKKAVEIYNRHTETDNGRKMVTWYNNELGVSAKYLVWFTKCIVCYNIPLYIVLDTYKDWKRYVVPYYKGNSQQLPDMGNLNYQQAVKIINECKRHWAKPNPIYEQNGIYVGEFKTFRDANMLPINTTWCITKTRQRFHDFNNEKSKCLYIINNHNQDPWRRVIAVIYDDRIDYWDSRNKRMDDIDQFDYEKTLPRDVIDIIHNVSLSNNNKNNDIKTEHMMRNKRTYRLTESKLRGIVHEAVRSVLMEGDGNKLTRLLPKVMGTINDASMMLDEVEFPENFGNQLGDEGIDKVEQIRDYLGKASDLCVMLYQELAFGRKNYLPGDGDGGEQRDYSGLPGWGG